MLVLMLVPEVQSFTAELAGELYQSSSCCCCCCGGARGCPGTEGAAHVAACANSLGLCFFCGRSSETASEIIGIASLVMSDSVCPCNLSTRPCQHSTKRSGTASTPLAGATLCRLLGGLCSMPKTTAAIFSSWASRQSSFKVVRNMKVAAR